MVILYQQIQIIMTHTYNITGMTCTGCLAKVQGLLQQVPNIEKVEISLAEGTADITMKKHVPTADLQQVPRLSVLGSDEGQRGGLGQPHRRRDR